MGKHNNICKIYWQLGNLFKEQLSTTIWLRDVYQFSANFARLYSMHQCRRMYFWIQETLKGLLHPSHWATSTWWSSEIGRIMYLNPTLEHAFVTRYHRMYYLVLRYLRVTWYPPRTQRLSNPTDPFPLSETSHCRLSLYTLIMPVVRHPSFLLQIITFDIDTTKLCLDLP